MFIPDQVFIGVYTEKLRGLDRSTTINGQCKLLMENYFAMRSEKNEIGFCKIDGLLALNQSATAVKFPSQESLTGRRVIYG